MMIIEVMYLRVQNRINKRKRNAELRRIKKEERLKRKNKIKLEI